VLNGDIAELLDELSMHYQTEKLKDVTTVTNQSTPKDPTTVS